MQFLLADSKLLTLEKTKWAEEFSFVAGVDEVGRGPLAGPVVAAAVVFPQGAKIPAVDDSKKLNEKQRRELKEAIMRVEGVQYAVAEVDEVKIDEINILRATHLAMRLAVEKLDRVDFLLVDGRPVPGLPVASLAVVKGDGNRVYSNTCFGNGQADILLFNGPEPAKAWRKQFPLLEAQNQNSVQVVL